jgi:hypothetical protein
VVTQIRSPDLHTLPQRVELRLMPATNPTGDRRCDGASTHGRSGAGRLDLLETQIDIGAV